MTRVKVRGAGTVSGEGDERELVPVCSWAFLEASAAFHRSWVIVRSESPPTEDPDLPMPAGRNSWASGLSPEKKPVHRSISFGPFDEEMSKGKRETEEKGRTGGVNLDFIQAEGELTFSLHLIFVQLMPKPNSPRNPRK